VEVNNRSEKVPLGDGFAASVREAVGDVFKSQISDLKDAVEELSASMRKSADEVPLYIMENAAFWDQIEGAVREQLQPTCELNFWGGVPAFSIWFGEDHPFVANGGKIEIAYEDFLGTKNFTDSDRLRVERQLTGVLSLMSELRLAKVALETRLRSQPEPSL
jgi:hypothetical protein